MEGVPQPYSLGDVLNHVFFKPLDLNGMILPSLIPMRIPMPGLAEILLHLNAFHITILAKEMGRDRTGWPWGEKRLDQVFATRFVWLGRCTRKNVFFLKYTMPSWWCSWANVCSCHIRSVSPSIKVNKKKSLEPPFGLWTHQMLQTFRANILLFLVTSSWWRTQVFSDPLKKIGAFRLVLGRVVLVATKMLSTCWSLFLFSSQDSPTFETSPNNRYTPEN